MIRAVARSACEAGSGRAMCKLVLRIKRGLGLISGARPDRGGGRGLLIYSGRGRFCRVANLETHFAIFVSLRIIKFRFFPHRAPVGDTFGHQPGLLFRRLAYFTRSLITINIRLSARSFVTACIFPCSRSIVVSWVGS